MNIIYGAIKQYRNQHGGKFPEKLSDLTPDYIHDSRVLTCPFVAKRGGLRTWSKRFREHSPDAYTSYCYEVPPVVMDYNMWRGLPKKTWQEFKLRAAVQLGDVIPIVRCHDHEPRLNLALGGEQYESEVYWEKNFTQDEQLLTVARLFASGAPVHPKHSDFLPRDPRAGAAQLDLADYYNATLTDSWHGYPGNHLNGLAPGIHEVGGVRFDARGVIQLRGSDIPADYPIRVEDIKVAQKCSRIHFLHAVSFVYNMGSTLAFYVVHYSNGQTQKMPLINGAQIADWWDDPKNSVILTDAKVAWTGENEAAKAYGKVLRLYQATWENPFPDLEIATITFDSIPGKYQAGPFVAAITLE